MMKRFIQATPAALRCSSLFTNTGSKSMFSTFSPMRTLSSSSAVPLLRRANNTTVLASSAHLILQQQMRFASSSSSEKKEESFDVRSKDLYKRLGVHRKANDDEIKKAYRKLAKLYHPDMMPNASDAEKAKATEDFQHVKEAYEILSDQKKRRFYNVTGTKGGQDFAENGTVRIHLDRRIALLLAIGAVYLLFKAIMRVRQVTGSFNAYDLFWTTAVVYAIPFNPMQIAVLFYYFCKDRMKMKQLEDMNKIIVVVEDTQSAAADKKNAGGIMKRISFQACGANNDENKKLMEKYSVEVVATVAKKQDDENADKKDESAPLYQHKFETAVPEFVDVAFSPAVLAAAAISAAAPVAAAAKKKATEKPDILYQLMFRESGDANGNVLFTKQFVLKK